MFKNPNEKCQDLFVKFLLKFIYDSLHIFFFFEFYSYRSNIYRAYDSFKLKHYFSIKLLCLYKKKTHAV